jgi:DNA-binding response OmpR family regulator
MSNKIKRILLIESESILAECTGFRLELLGYQVETVSTGMAAEDAIAKQKPDIILLNLQLSDQPGLTFVEKLTSQTELTTIPILALSLEGESDTVAKAFAVGISDMLLIPYDPSILEDKVIKLLNIAKRNEEPTKKKTKATATATA